MQNDENTPSAGMPSLSDAIEKLMANPEIISMVASALGNPTVKEDTDKSESEQAKAVSAPTLPPDVGNILSTLSPLLSGVNKQGGGKHHESTDSGKNREALLYALRPYISQGRREAIDYILQLSRVTELIKQAK